MDDPFASTSSSRFDGCDLSRWLRHPVSRATPYTTPVTTSRPAPGTVCQGWTGARRHAPRAPTRPPRPRRRLGGRPRRHQGVGTLRRRRTARRRRRRPRAPAAPRRVEPPRRHLGHPRAAHDTRARTPSPAPSASPPRKPACRYDGDRPAPHGTCSTWGSGPTRPSSAAPPGPSNPSSPTARASRSSWIPVEPGRRPAPAPGLRRSWPALRATIDDHAARRRRRRERRRQRARRLVEGPRRRRDPAAGDGCHGARRGRGARVSSSCLRTGGGRGGPWCSRATHAVPTSPRTRRWRRRRRCARRGRRRAPASGDDAIVSPRAAAPWQAGDGPVVVVTADRELRDRVRPSARSCTGRPGCATSSSRPERRIPGPLRVDGSRSGRRRSLPVRWPYRQRRRNTTGGSPWSASPGPTTESTAPPGRGPPPSTGCSPTCTSRGSSRHRNPSPSVTPSRRSRSSPASRASTPGPRTSPARPPSSPAPACSASSTTPPPASRADATDDLWSQADRAPVETIVHGDFAPYNCVYDGIAAVGLIDFDTAHPGPRVWDVASAVYRFAPFTTGAVEGIDRPRPRRAARTRRRVLPRLRPRRPLPQRPGRDDDRVPRRPRHHASSTEAAAGNPKFVSDLQHGHADLYRADVAYLEQHADARHRRRRVTTSPARLRTARFAAQGIAAPGLRPHRGRRADAGGAGAGPRPGALGDRGPRSRIDAGRRPRGLRPRGTRPLVADARHPARPAPRRPATAALAHRRTDAPHDRPTRQRARHRRRPARPGPGCDDRGPGRWSCARPR